MTLADKKARPGSESRLLVACVLLGGALFLLGSLYLYVRSTHRPERSSGPARSITSEQAQILLQELAKHPAHSLTIKTDESDRDASRFARQLYETLRTSQWQVALSTDSTGPAVGTGLCVAQTGEDARPPYADLAQDPYFFLPDVLEMAHLEVGAETGQSAGAYKLYLIVGHREETQIATRHGYVLRAAERWLLRHLKALRGA